jgi:riboflavin synthase
MFTGIVEEIGRVHELARVHGTARLAVACGRVLDGVAVGDSIAVNGCCLTVTDLSGAGFVADLMGETLDRTALGDLAPGAPVNLERALAAGERLGGHLVQGHVDGVGAIAALEAHGGWTTMTVTLPEGLERYVAERGSIAVDGTSLTVTSVERSAFSVGLIPHTLSATALGSRRLGDRVNLEVDILAKYVERLLAAGGLRGASASRPVGAPTYQRSQAD